MIMSGSRNMTDNNHKRSIDRSWENTRHHVAYPAGWSFQTSPTPKKRNKSSAIPQDETITC